MWIRKAKLIKLIDQRARDAVLCQRHAWMVCPGNDAEYCASAVLKCLLEHLDLKIKRIKPSERSFKLEEINGKAKT